MANMKRFDDFIEMRVAQYSYGTYLVGPIPGKLGILGLYELTAAREQFVKALVRR